MKMPDYSKILRVVVILAAVLCCLRFVIGTNIYEKNNEKAAVTETGLSYFRSFSLNTPDGKTFTEGDLKAYKVTVINGWAPWCGPCVNEMPDLSELNGEYGEKGLQVIGIVADYSMTYDKAEYDRDIAAILEKTRVTYPILLSDETFTDEVFPTMRNAFPCTWAVDSDGNLLETVHGGKTRSDWQKYFDKWLEAAEHE